MNVLRSCFLIVSTFFFSEMELVEPDLQYVDEYNASILERMPRLNLPNELGKFFFLTHREK